MKNLFIPYEIALKLKQLGFDESCFACFETNTEFHVPFIVGFDLETPKHFNQQENCIAVPLYQQVIDWFREEHKLQIVIYYCGDKYPTVEEDYDAYCFTINEDCGFILDTYEEAREAAILKAINIIENGKTIC